MANIMMTIQYDGTNYLGWQRQKKGNAVQAKIEEALSEIFKKEIKIRGAGRTDAGVHALSQVASFKEALKLPLYILKKAVNSLLPSDIRVINIQEVDDTFHPRFSAKRKSYIYYLYNDEECSCFIQRYVWHYKRKLNLSAMQDAARLFIGCHDFTAFSGSTDVKDKVRTIYDLSVEPVESLCFLDMEIRGSFLKFRIEADGFLKYMARNIVGCLVEVGRGGLSMDNIQEAINTGKRPNPLRTAPPQGLFLEKITY
ncbi:tRNA pseudouridine(38-40) synthase TruA [Thermodesulfovibrio hydrogeniphilus]